MAFELWLAYAIAATIIIVIPGPTILLVITQSLIHGKAATLPLVLGVMLGDALALLLSLFGLGAILATSAFFFTIIKWVGAGYLVYLGISLWRSPSVIVTSDETVEYKGAFSLFMRVFIVTTFNPKGIVFFIAFLPQFVDPALDVVAQLALLGVTFVVIGTLNAAMYAIFSGALKRFLQREKARRWFNRCGGTALVGAGVFTAVAQRA